MNVVENVMVKIPALPYNGYDDSDYKLVPRIDLKEHDINYMIQMLETIHIGEING